MDIEELVHPLLAPSSMNQLGAGHYREAVLNAIAALYDLIRTRTGLDLDGAELIGKAFSEKRPYLRVADLGTQSGRNTQVGFMQMANGLYQGVRSPNVHSTTVESNRVQAVRYMATASALAELVCEAQPGDVIRTDGVYASKADDRSANFLRFFADGTVVAASVNTSSVDDEWVPDWLTVDWAKQYDRQCGRVSIEGNAIEFTVPIQGRAELQYRGQINGLTLVLRTFSTATNSGSQGKYHFRPLRR